ncbi:MULTISPECIES: hypothetical protein [unclassified Kitasatospora]|uniref:hypothetical protein n=1 Tax=unclassified Kitasatospora TaxID=2633591 RepID=UPI00070AE984|nr:MULTISPECIES: hypothetical protein [unclassified Kitasatospora]KQV04519.1 hypothetical protein ASC99_14030 [Kitasatospora sp. Root107]KRB60951.1 hypothetical protein ASE03_11475 [Kitasatospora sp. Root187]
MSEEVDFRPDGFHRALDSELATLTAPPLGDLVGLAARGGRRKRRLRAAGAALGSVTAVAALAVLVGSLGTGPAQSTAVGPAAGPPAAAPASGSATPEAPSSATPSPVVTPAAPQVPATTAALLAAVVQSLPAGYTTDHHAADPPESGASSIFAYVNTPTGTGRISVAAYIPEEPAPCTPGPSRYIATNTVSCTTSPAGDVVEVEVNPSNCMQATDVRVHRPGGFEVSVTISDCLNWDGAKNPHAVPALTHQQAVALASSPLIGTTMPASFVEAANAKYPALPTP